ncbi:MAG: hypothetical protein M1820_009759 [Bogoriella megaspora]|nr:MAG: hypothetical protein M1820_009759 [Bogoriella megaspora]
MANITVDISEAIAFLVQIITSATITVAENMPMLMLYMRRDGKEQQLFVREQMKQGTEEQNRHQEHLNPLPNF